MCKCCVEYDLPEDKEGIMDLETINDTLEIGMILENEYTGKYFYKCLRVQIDYCPSCGEKLTA